MAKHARTAVILHEMTDSLNLYRSQQDNCAYLPNRLSSTLFVDPAAPMDVKTYSYLLAQGFRRSGRHIYKPYCDACQACTPLRLPVARFKPNRNQRRIWAKSAENLTVNNKPAAFQSEHFDLYCRYIESRHPDGGMVNSSPDDFLNFLTSSWCKTNFFELYIAEKLTAVAVTDLLPNGLSAVYTFFDPELSHLSPGVLALLWQIYEAQRRNLPWLYLGYWVPGCTKMSYKSNYRPLQIRKEDQWQEFDKNAEIFTFEME